MDKGNRRPGQPNFQIDYNNWKNAGQIQDFIQKQLWCAGGTFNSQVGQVVNTTVKWGGQSRFLAGFNFFAQNIFNHTLSITLNNELMIDAVPLTFLTPNGAFGNIKFQQYFEFIRPLSGSDVMVFSLVSTVAEPVGYGIYMTRAYNRYYARD